MVFPAFPEPSTIGNPAEHPQRCPWCRLRSPQKSIWSQGPRPCLKNWSMRGTAKSGNSIFFGSFLSLLVLHHPQYWTIPMFEVNAGCMLLQKHPCPTKICTKIGSSFWNTPRKSKELWSQRQMFIPLSSLTLSISGFPTIKEVAV